MTMILFVMPNEKSDIQTANAKIHFDENAFYDAVPLSVSETNAASTNQVSPTIQISYYLIPVHDDMMFQ